MTRGTVVTPSREAQLMRLDRRYIAKLRRTSKRGGDS
jgi:hypothetical protein